MLIEKKPEILLHGVFKDEFFDVLRKRKTKRVFVLEGRPYLRGAKFLCKELLKRKITPILIADNMAGFLFYKGLVKRVWMAYQDINKSVAFCPIGGLVLAVLGRRHKVPVNIFPSVIKENLMGMPKDIFNFNGLRVAAKGIKGYVPLIDEVPRKYITEIF